MRYVLIMMVLILSYSCKTNTENNAIDNDKKFKSSELKYAKGFSLREDENFKYISIHNPWQKAEGVEYNYLLLNKDLEIPDNSENFKIIRTPVKKVICLSTTHVAFIDVLDETESIVAVSGTKYVNNIKLKELIKDGEIQDIGYDNSINYELIASLDPDLVITYGIGGQVAGYNQKLNDLGIETIIIAEYLENHPLGKLEWLKLFGALYEKEDKANEYFETVSKEYIDLLGITNNAEDKPKVLLGLPWKSTWYVPGGESFLAKMIEDAGGDYIWKENNSRESLPFGIESIFANASNADIWINTGTANDKNDILNLDERFKSFSPFIHGKIYNNNLQVNESGGNNYWEDGLIEPQNILKDLIKIFHPELLPEHKFVYYKIIE